MSPKMHGSGDAGSPNATSSALPEKAIAVRGCLNFCKAYRTQREPVGPDPVPFLDHDSV